MGLFCPKVNRELHGECLAACMVVTVCPCIWYHVLPRVCMDLVSSFHVFHVELVNVH